MEEQRMIREEQQRRLMEERQRKLREEEWMKMMQEQQKKQREEQHMILMEIQQQKLMEEEQRLLREEQERQLARQRDEEDQIYAHNLQLETALRDSHYFAIDEEIKNESILMQESLDNIQSKFLIPLKNHLKIKKIYSMKKQSSYQS